MVLQHVRHRHSRGLNDRRRDRSVQVVGEIYTTRFEGLIEQRRRLWQVLCASFFQEYISSEDTVLDLGAGYCEFINHIVCRRKLALDINEDAELFANPDVEVLCASATERFPIPNDSVDVVFASHFFEHLHSKGDMIAVLNNVKDVLKPGGLLLILGPNIRYSYDEYWDFFDHRIPLSDKAVTEILRALGFEIVKVLPRFLPYTTKSRYPRWPILVKLYLRLPLAYRVFGKQMFIVGRKRSI